MEDKILEILHRLETKIDDNSKDIKEMKSKIDAVYNQTADDLTEFRTQVNIKLDELRYLKNVTKVNCDDIAELKVIN